MKRRFKVPLLAVIVLAVSLPAGFAIAQIVDGKGEADEPPITHVDPDPSTDAIELRETLIEARESGDQEAIEKAAKAVRDEWFSRLQAKEKLGAETSSPEADVPADTYAFVNEAITPTQVDQCRGRLAEGRHGDELCELIILYSEGKIEAGPYTKDEVEAVLREKGETR